MLHKAWNSKGEVPYCFPKSSIKFQGHTGQNITAFDPNWAFPDYRPVAAFKSLRFALFYNILFNLTTKLHITGHLWGNPLVILLVIPLKKGQWCRELPRVSTLCMRCVRLCSFTVWCHTLETLQYCTKPLIWTWQISTTYTITVLKNNSVNILLSSIKFHRAKDNSSPSGQNGRHFTDDIFRCICMNEKFCISIQISLKFVPKGPNDNYPVLIQIKAWYRIGDKPLAEPMVTRFTDIYMQL